MGRFLITNGRVVDPAAGIDEPLEVLVEMGKIAALGRNLDPAGARVIDAAGRVVAPGLVDLHAHFRDPGYTDREDIVSGTRAAAAGGFTTVAVMPNTRPVVDHPVVVEYILSRARREGLVNVVPFAAITRGQKGEELAPMYALARAGAVGFSDDGEAVASSDLMRRALQYSRLVDRVVAVHPEDRSLSAEGVMREGSLAARLGLRGVPWTAEAVMVARDILLAEETGARLHLCHLSTARSVDLLRQARARGIPVTAEVTPHHLTLTLEAVDGYNTLAKINPPLGTAEDVAALKEGLRDGTIQVIATDHAPHTTEDKQREFDLAPSGIIGLETALSLVLQALVFPGVISLSRALAAMTIWPARILGLDKGTLRVGADADLVIIDLEREWTVDVNRYRSKSRNCPYHGRRMRGRAVLTMVGGRVVAREGEIVEDPPGSGEYLG